MATDPVTDPGTSTSAAGDFIYAPTTAAHIDEVLSYTGVSNQSSGSSGSVGSTTTYGDGWTPLVPGPRGIKIFDKPGTFSWTAPRGVFSIEVAIYSAGAAGGVSSTYKTAGGGGSGAFGIYCVGVTPLKVYTNSITVGAGGVGADNYGTGNSGGSSTCTIGGITVTLTGGVGGTPTSAGAGGTVPKMTAIEFDPTVRTEPKYFTGLDGATSNQGSGNSYGGKPANTLAGGLLDLTGGFGYGLWINTRDNNGGAGASRAAGAARRGEDGVIILRW